MMLMVVEIVPRTLFFLEFIFEGEIESRIFSQPFHKRYLFVKGQVDVGIKIWQNFSIYLHFCSAWKVIEALALRIFIKTPLSSQPKKKLDKYVIQLRT